MLPCVGPGPFPSPAEREWLSVNDDDEYPELTIEPLQVSDDASRCNGPYGEWHLLSDHETIPSGH